jgi:uncharacterized protein YcfJ
MASDDDSFKMNPVSLGAVIGAVVAFIMVGAIVTVVWVAIGALIGGFVGYMIRRYGMEAATFSEAVDLRERSSKEDLYELARSLGIEGRSQMDKDQLVAAITERQREQKATNGRSERHPTS